MPLILLIIMSWTVYRVTRLLIADTLIEQTRDRFLRWLMPPPTWTVDLANLAEGRSPFPPAQPSFWRRKLYELVTCPYCLSIWVAGAAVLMVLPFASLPLPLFWWPALSTGSLITWRIVENN